MSVVRNSAVAGAGAPRRTYITMRVYNDDIFTYTTSLNSDLQTIGRLAPVTGATAGNCAKGAFLRETGKRLYPNVNPGISTLMVGVYDFATGLSGFIDPNSFAFSPQNTDRAYYIDSAGYNPNSADAPLRSDQGPPVYTHGDVLADGNLYIGGHASTIGNAYVEGNQSTFGNVAVGGNDDVLGSLIVRGGSAVYGPFVQGTVTVLTSPNSGELVINCSLGNVFQININSGNDWSLNASNVTPGQPVTLIFNNVYANANTYTPTIGFNSKIWEAGNLVLTANRVATVSYIGFLDTRTAGNYVLAEVSRTSNEIPA